MEELFDEDQHFEEELPGEDWNLTKMEFKKAVESSNRRSD